MVLLVKTKVLNLSRFLPYCMGAGGKKCSYCYGTIGQNKGAEPVMVLTIIAWEPEEKSYCYGTTGQNKGA